MSEKRCSVEQRNGRLLPPVADINVTPMVDVMLVLLIIFMVITPMLNKGVAVDMAKVNNLIAMQAADKERRGSGSGHPRRQGISRFRRSRTRRSSLPK